MNSDFKNCFSYYRSQKNDKSPSDLLMKQCSSQEQSFEVLNFLRSIIFETLASDEYPDFTRVYDYFNMYPIFLHNTSHLLVHMYHFRVVLLIKLYVLFHL